MPKMTARTARSITAYSTVVAALLWGKNCSFLFRRLRGSRCWLDIKNSFVLDDLIKTSFGGSGIVKRRTTSAGLIQLAGKPKTFGPPKILGLLGSSLPGLNLRDGQGKEVSFFDSRTHTGSCVLLGVFRCCGTFFPFFSSMKPKFTTLWADRSSASLGCVSSVFLFHPKDALPGEIEAGHPLMVGATGEELVVHINPGSYIKRSLLIAELGLNKRLGPL